MLGLGWVNGADLHCCVTSAGLNMMESLTGDTASDNMHITITQLTFSRAPTSPAYKSMDGGRLITQM